jgi:predicted RNA-binding Zn-ribbon protein involved in translation (DUF1610 family)
MRCPRPLRTSASIPAQNAVLWLGCTIQTRSLNLIEADTKHHTHRCQACGMIWGHSDLMVGDVEAHTCPKCGQAEWRIFQGAKLAAHGGAPPPQQAAPDAWAILTQPNFWLAVFLASALVLISLAVSKPWVRR